VTRVVFLYVVSKRVFMPPLIVNFEVLLSTKSNEIPTKDPLERTLDIMSTSGRAFQKA